MIERQAAVVDEHGQPRTPTQFITTTFRPELIHAGQRFYGVPQANKAMDNGGGGGFGGANGANAKAKSGGGKSVKFGGAEGGKGYNHAYRTWRVYDGQIREQRELAVHAGAHPHGARRTR